MRRLQHVREVRGVARPGTAPVRVRCRRDRSLRAAPGRRRRSRPPVPGAGRGQGSDLLPVRPADGPARARPVPTRRADQARGARRRALARPGDRRQAREPGDLLRARRRLSGRVAHPSRLAARARPAARRGWDTGRRARRHRGVHGRAASGSRGRARTAALCLAHRPADEHHPAGPPRGSRDARVHGRAGIVHRTGDAGRRLPCLGADPPPGRRRSRRRSARSVIGAGRSAPTRRSGPLRRVRQPCSTTATRRSAVGGSPTGSSRSIRGQRPAASGARARRRVTIEPSLVCPCWSASSTPPISVAIRGQRAGGFRYSSPPRSSAPGPAMRSSVGWGSGSSRSATTTSSGRRSWPGWASRSCRSSRSSAPTRRAGVSTDDRSTAKFLRGLTIGAILGALIAGSRIWRTLERRDPKRQERRPQG